jgi:hypothetical protein
MSDHEWRHGAPFSRLNADKVAAEFEKIRAKSGSLGSQAVVDYAQSHKRSELFKAFDWDKEVSANRWWLHQAQDLISAVREVRLVGGDTVVTRSNYSIGGGVFVTSKEVEENVDYQTAVMRRALSSLEGWRDRYSEIVHLCGASDPLNDALNLLRASLAQDKAAE